MYIYIFYNCCICKYMYMYYRLYKLIYVLVLKIKLIRKQKKLFQN